MIKRILFITIAGVFLSNVFNIARAQTPGVIIRVFNVGYGDAVLVRTQTKNPFYILIDAGEKLAGPKLISYFQKENISHIDLGIITHPHKNHFGGYSELLDRISFKRILINGDLNGEEGYTELLEKIKAKNILLSTVKRGDIVDSLPAEMTIQILNPDQLTYTTNGNSLSAWLLYKTKKILFTADIEPAQQNAILKSFPQIKEADLVQIPHHGGEMSEAFQQAFPKAVFFVSTGVNDFGLPNEKDFLNLIGHAYRTDKGGNITFTMTEKDIKVTRE